MDASGNIAKPQEAASTPVTEAIDKIKQTIAEQISSHSTTEDEVITESVEPPTATLAFNATPPQNSHGNSRAALHREASLAQMENGATRFYTSVGHQQARFLDVSV